MSTTVSYAGNQYNVPAYGDTGYAQGAGNLSSYLVALATGSLTLSGGAFTLTADANFGSNFGLVALYFKSVSAGIAASGVLRLANAEKIAWRNALGNADLTLAINASNQLTFNSAVLASATGIVPVAAGGTNSGTALSNGFLMASVGGAIVESAVALATKALSAITSISSDTANRAASGFLRLANTEAIAWRNNLNNADISLAKNASDQLSYAGTVFLSSAGVVPVAAGGTNSAASLVNGKLMVSSGGAIIEAGADSSMNSHKITSLANGTAATDAAAFGQVKYLQTVQATTTSTTSVTANTFTATALTGSITVTSGNRVKITISGLWTFADLTRTYNLTIERGTTNLAGATGFLAFFPSITGTFFSQPVSFSVVDPSPSAGANTYTVYIKNDNNVAATTFPSGGLNLTSVMLLEEIV